MLGKMAKFDDPPKTQSVQARKEVSSALVTVSAAQEQAMHQPQCGVICDAEEVVSNTSTSSSASAHAPVLSVSGIPMPSREDVENYFDSMAEQAKQNAAKQS